MEERKIKLKDKINKLLTWKREFESNQISYPMGVLTNIIVYDNHFVVQPDFQIAGTTNLSLEVSLDGKIYYLPVITNP